MPFTIPEFFFRPWTFPAWLTIVPWWLMQIANMSLLYSTQMVFRQLGPCLASWLYYSVICVFCVTWMTQYVIKFAGGLFWAHFLGLSLLVIFGILGSWLYFKEPVSLTNWIGVAFIAIGAALILVR